MKTKTINTYIKEDFAYICKRLKEIRIEIRNDHGGVDSKNPYTQKNVASYIGVALASMVRLEDDMINFNTIKLITIYQAYGYNPEWIIMEDNEFINKKILQDNIVVRSDIQSHFLTMQEDLLKILSTFKSKL